MSDDTKGPVPAGQGMGLGSGKAEFSFSCAGQEPFTTASEKTLYPERGFVTFWMELGEWELSSVIVDGYWAKQDGTPGRKKGNVTFSGPLDDDAPGWLHAESEEWVRAMNSARTKAERMAYMDAFVALNASSLPPLPKGKALLRGLIPDPDAYGLAMRVLDAEVERLKELILEQARRDSSIPKGTEVTDIQSLLSRARLVDPYASEAPDGRGEGA